MAAPRATQWIALRKLVSAGRQQHVRTLHMTGPATYASPAFTKERTKAMLPRDQNEQSGRSTITGKNVALVARHFNTSRSLKSVGDSSTIDFAYLPSMEMVRDMDIVGQLRVPILPDNYSFDSSSVRAAEAEQVVMKPEISTVSADAVFLPMAEAHDGHALNIDFHAMADRVAANLRRMQVPVEQQAGMMKQLWNDMVDDVLGLPARKPLTP